MANKIAKQEKSCRRHLPSAPAPRVLLAAGAAALVVVGLGSNASAGPLNPHKLVDDTGHDVTGMNPMLVASRDSQRIYFLAASPDGKVGRFNAISLKWEWGIKNITTMSGIDLNKAFCKNVPCAGGPGLAVGQNDVLHVVWGERGLMDCDPNSGFYTSVNVLYSRYDGSGWSNPYPVVKRQTGQHDVECAYQYPSLAEDGNGNLLVSYMHAIYNPVVSKWDHEGTYYYNYNTSGWHSQGCLWEFAQQSYACGGFGRLLLGYARVGHSHVAEIDVATGAATSDEVIAKLTSAPYLLLSAKDDLHAFMGGPPVVPDDGGVHSGSIYYNRKTGGAWEYADSRLLSDDPNIFVPPPPNQELGARVGLAVLPSGKRLYDFSYNNKLYLIYHNGTDWAANPIWIDTGNDVASQAVAAVGDNQYLVVWSVDWTPTAEIGWALGPGDSETVLQDAGPDASLSDGGDAAPLDASDGSAHGDASDHGDGSAHGDASASLDGSAWADAAANLNAAEDEGGCGCRVLGSQGRPDSAGLAVGLLALLELAARRRLRYRRSSRWAS